MNCFRRARRSVGAVRATIRNTRALQIADSGADGAAPSTDTRRGIQINVDSAQEPAHTRRVDPTWLLLSSLFSLIGLAVFTYGRKQRTATHTLVGVVLMGYPYFVKSLIAMVAIGIVLLVAMVVGNGIENG